MSGICITCARALKCLTRSDETVFRFLSRCPKCKRVWNEPDYGVLVYYPNECPRIKEGDVRMFEDDGCWMDTTCPECAAEKADGNR